MKSLVFTVTLKNVSVASAVEMASVIAEFISEGLAGTGIAVSVRGECNETEALKFAEQLRTIERREA